ncbi:hypothetical protein WR25_03480 [Diploscapter pachys]|uniref:Uncharacterized protein n=1 Tax=Diploscapter pachys TaxID=2018661 RepID=A0A2A2LB02_9BILA|nr:hypothetical protein WR25_03480 [Diploscapter pachys]
MIRKDLFDRLNRTSDALQDFQDKVTTNQQGVVPINQNFGEQTTQSPTGSNQSGIVSAEERRIPLFGDDYTRNPLILYFHGIAVFSHGISYIIILGTAHFILKTLKKKQTTMSMETLSKNELLVHAVFAEAFLPLVLAAPVAANALLTALNWQEYLPMYLISLVPLLSPLISILFVPAYRHCIVDFLIFKKLRKAKPQQQVVNDEITAPEPTLVEVSM